MSDDMATGHTAGPFTVTLPDFDDVHEQYHAARLDEAAGDHPDDRDFDAPGPVLKTCRFAVRQRVRWGSVAGWVEVVGISKIGLRLVNGNFWWVDPDDVRPDGPAAADPFGDGRP